MKIMSEERDTFWASFIERIFGLVLIVLGAVLLYFTVYNGRFRRAS